MPVLLRQPGGGVRTPVRLDDLGKRRVRQVTGLPLRSNSPSPETVCASNSAQLADCRTWVLGRHWLGWIGAGTGSQVVETGRGLHGPRLCHLIVDFIRICSHVSAVFFVMRPKEIGPLSAVSNHEQPNLQEIEP